MYLMLLGWTLAVVRLSATSSPGLLTRVTIEDSLVEWLSVASLGVLSACSGYWAGKTKGFLRWLFAALALLALLALGEEISWGQRLFGVESSAFMLEHNQQGENNLHNLMPAGLFNGLLVFGLVLVFVLIPMLAERAQKWTGYLPSLELRVMALGAVAINHYVFSPAEQIGIGFLLLLLAWVSKKCFDEGGRALLVCASVYIAILFLYNHRQVLNLYNHQYEIRELLIVWLTGFWCHDLYQTHRAV